jgi:tellurite resistance protein TehA-like permease
MVFSMTWYSFVFPNTALVTATFAIGKAFESTAVEILGCVMTVLLFLTYFFVFYMMVRAIFLRHILWPQKGEDKDEGGFRIEEIRSHTAAPIRG